MDIQATYSPEDNKLRLYASARLDEDTYKLVKDAGFKWAPRQELFVAPRWTPAREDLCLELAGEIEPEQTTMIERAEAKIDRLETVQENAERRANRYHDTASELAEAFAYGQPILVGHHSERKARRNQEKIHSNMRNAVAERKKIQHFQWKAAGVARHANQKNSTRTRLNRIKTLLAELRDLQRTINHAAVCLEYWQPVKEMEDTEARHAAIRKLASGELTSGSFAPWDWRRELDRDEIEPDAFLDKVMANNQRIIDGPTRKRWIVHTLNRIGYEQGELGETRRFEGELTAAILQTFTRTHGAHKPKAKATEDGWQVTSIVTLPMHIGKGAKELALTADEWRDLMQGCGYEVPAPAPKKPPILNFRAERIKGKRVYNTVEEYEQIEMTKAEFSAMYSDRRWVAPSACGTFRFKVCQDPNNHGWNAKLFAVYLTDSKTHDTPDSDAVTLKGTVDA